MAKTPILLVVRGQCDDKALASAIRETLDRVPVRSRNTIMEYVCTEHPFSITGKGLRFEALGRWPGMGDAAGMNLARGHAIRLRASLVRTRPVQEVVDVIAHELAHTEQKAEGREFESENDCERDVEERLKLWNFASDETEDEERTLRDELDACIRAAKNCKATLRSGERPSGNFAAAAIREAEKATNALIRASERWRGE